MIEARDEIGGGVDERAVEIEDGERGERAGCHGNGPLGYASGEAIGAFIRAKPRQTALSLQPHHNVLFVGLKRLSFGFRPV